MDTEQLQEIVIPWDAPNPIALSAPAIGQARVDMPIPLTEVCAQTNFPRSRVYRLIHAGKLTADPRVNVSVSAGQSQIVDLPNGRRVKITREAQPYDPSAHIQEVVIPWNTANPHPLRVRDYSGPDWREGAAARFGDKTVEVPLEPGEARLVDLPNGSRVRVRREAKPLPGATPATPATPATVPAASAENAERPAHAREDFDRLERKP